MKFHIAVLIGFVAAAPMNADTIPVAVATEVKMVPQAQSCHIVYGPDGRVLYNSNATEARNLPICDCITPERHRNTTAPPSAVRTTTSRQLPLPTGVAVNRSATRNQATIAAPQNRRMERETNDNNHVENHDGNTERLVTGKCIRTGCSLAILCTSCIMTCVCVHGQCPTGI